jgi:hypothetical protein
LYKLRKNFSLLQPPLDYKKDNLYSFIKETKKREYKDNYIYRILKIFIVFASRFHELFKKYHEEVYPAKLVFVSFFSYQQSKGHMVPKLEELGFKPLRFVFDLNRPDLTKLDKLFGMLATGTSSFNDEIAEMEDIIKTKGIAKAFDSLTI